MILKDLDNNAYKLSNRICRVLRKSRHSVEFNGSVKASQIFRFLVKFNLIIAGKEVNKRYNSIIIKFLREFVNNWREIPVFNNHPIDFHCVITKTIFIPLLFFLTRKYGFLYGV